LGSCNPTKAVRRKIVASRNEVPIPPEGNEEIERLVDDRTALVRTKFEGCKTDLLLVDFRRGECSMRYRQ
jgi:hypothetical protein